MTRLNSAGFSLWELMVVIALIIVLVLTAIENLLPLMGDAERVAHASTRGALQSAVGLESTMRVLDRGNDGLRAMRDANPVDWLQTPMNNYVGEISGRPYEAIPPRRWAFDKHSQVLVYRVGFPEYFTGDSMAPAVIRYRVTVQDGPGGTPRGVFLEQIDAGEWITDGSVLARWIGG